MSIFGRTSQAQLDIGTTLLRVIVGIVFAAHGAQKLFMWSIDGVAQGFGGMGIPLAGVAAPAVTFLELLGGIALVIGLLTRPVAAGLAVTMLGAMFFAHIPEGFFLPGGVEFVLVLFAAAVMFALVGGGRWSVDARLAGRAAGQDAPVLQAAPAGSRRAA